MTPSPDHCGKCGMGFAYGSSRIHMNDGRVYHQGCLDAQPVPELEIKRLRERCADLLAVLDTTHKLITEGALVGFIPTEGTWADLLFKNQGRIHDALRR